MPTKAWTIIDIPPQIGKVALVTGATAGIGYETALALAQAEATVILAGRNEEKGKDALQRICAVLPDAKIEFGKVDQVSLASVKEFATSISSKFESLDLLINNAGIVAPMERSTTKDGFEIVFGTNHLSHFALTAHLLPLLRNTSSPRIVRVSSLVHRQGEINFDDLQSEKCNYGPGVYNQSKIANLLFTFELQRRSDGGGWGIMSNAAHPGISRTDISNNKNHYTTGCMGLLSKYIIMPIVSQSSVDGALPILFAATSLEAKECGYYGPNGFNEMKGPPAPSYIAPKAKNTIVAAKLWDISVNLTGVVWPEIPNSK